MRHFRRFAPLGLVALLGATAVGCISGIDSGGGTFDRNLTVTGPTVIDLANGAGKVEIRTGSPGNVRIHGEFRVQAWIFGSPEHEIADVTQHPPIEQEGNLIRIGHDERSKRNLIVIYTIEVPVETELRSKSGSGDLEVRGIRGPVRTVSGSGDVTADQIGEDTEVSTGSGDIKLTDIAGQAQATAGSGDLRLRGVKGEVRVHTGSGDVTIEHASGAVTAGTASGSVDLRSASGDIRVRTSSGDVTIEGDPSASSYWEIHTSSGAVTLHVPSSAGFRLATHSNSGQTNSTLPLVVEEKGRRDLRAHFGNGQGRIEVTTSSGDITVH